jgi:hypothetical protein
MAIANAACAILDGTAAVFHSDGPDAARTDQD